MKSFSHSRRLTSLTLVACTVGLAVQAAAAAPSVFYDAGDPTSQEQYFLERINTARANPAAEGAMLADCKDPNVLNNYAFFKKNYGFDVATLRPQFTSYPTQPPLAMNRALMASARRQSLDMATWGVQSHNSSDGTTFDARIRAAGYAYSAAGENIYAYTLNPFVGHVGLNADWGVPSLGHRQNLMNYPTAEHPDLVFKEIGVSVVDTVVKKDSAGNAFGPLIVTQDFGRPADRNQAFICGVVFNDRNGNGAYDEGEGLAGVTITPDRGDFYTVTGASGGYTLPLPNGATSLSVTAIGGQLGEGRAQTIAVTPGTNVKVDFHTQDAPSTAPALAATAVGAVTTAKEANVVSGLNGAVQIVRNGGDNSRALAVGLAFSGTAVNGVDYAPLPAQVTIPAGTDGVTLNVIPLNGGASAVKKAKIKVAAGNDYVVPVEASTAKVKILPANAQ